MARSAPAGFVNLRIPRQTRRGKNARNRRDDMSVGSICTRIVATVNPNAGIVEAAKLMREAHVGDLIVVDSGEGGVVPVGIITDRDIVVSVVAKEASPADLTVRDVMQSDLVSVREDDEIETALERMHSEGVRRAPVTGNEGALVGILSIDDVIGHLGAQLGHIGSLIGIEQQRETRARP
jgi:CBS domain-containing protein